MSRNLIRELGILLLLVITGAECFLGQSPTPFSGPTKPVIVWVKQNGTTPNYFVDGKDISADPLRGIAESYEKHGGSQAHYPVIAIVDDRLPLSTIDQVRGLIGKVGFTDCRFFLISLGGKRMGELIFGAVVQAPDKAKLP